MSHVNGILHPMYIIKQAVNEPYYRTSRLESLCQLLTPFDSTNTAMSFYEIKLRT